MKVPASPAFLLEVGTEEIPDRMLDRAGSDLADGLRRALEPLALLTRGSAWSVWTTPRRLAVAVGPIRERQEDREEEAMGPSVKVAFDAEGRPTRAAEGFARGQGVPVGDLRQVETPKGVYVAVTRKVPGRAAADLLAEAVPEVLRKLHFPKMMRWGEVGFRFVRPIRWLLALLEDQVVPLEVAGVQSGDTSRGHRQVCGPLRVPRAADYPEVLRGAGVLCDPAERREVIRAGLAEAARQAGGRLCDDPALLEILVHMTELPSVITGTFPEEYLDLPREVLVTAMRHHQRFFSVHRSQDSDDLLPAFLAVLNMAGDPLGVVRRGNEWVLRARLADARFFWTEDRRKRLEERRADLERVIFQEKLGTYAEKVRRIAEWIEPLAASLGMGAEVGKRARRAAELAKCDLATLMVGEFPELQGVMGGIYAAADGEPEAVCAALRDHYRPAGAGDALPEGAEGRLLGLADRLDTLAGTFAIGAEPTGTRDPLALRRAAQGVVRILIESPGPLSLREAIDAALGTYPEGIRRQAQESGAAGRLAAFFTERARQVFLAAGHRYDSVAAVLAVQSDDLGDASRRLAALTTLRGDAAHEEDFLSLSSAFKRIRNLVREQDRCQVDPDALQEPPEVELARELDRVEREIGAPDRTPEPLEALRAIASLRPAVDGFLGSSREEGVLVLAPDPRLRSNRVALLQRAGDLFSRVADFSEIVVEGELTDATRGPARVEGRS